MAHVTRLCSSYLPTDLLDLPRITKFHQQQRCSRNCLQRRATFASSSHMTEPKNWLIRGTATEFILECAFLTGGGGKTWLSCSYFKIEGLSSEQKDDNSSTKESLRAVNWQISLRNSVLCVFCRSAWQLRGCTVPDPAWKFTNFVSASGGDWIQYNV